MSRLDVAYMLGFEDGHTAAIHCCTGYEKRYHNFETVDEVEAYEEGYDDGYESIDD